MTNESLNLLPCAHCGGAVVLHHGHGNITYVLCGEKDDGSDGCGAITSFRPNLRGMKTVAAWNRRTPQPDKAGVCKCSLRVKLVGDGCAVCNPEYAAQFATPPPPVAGEDRRDAPSATGRYFCDGPSGHFYIENLLAARVAVDMIDPGGDDWTITDTTAAMLGEGNG